MKRLFSIFLLCLLAQTAWSQSGEDYDPENPADPDVYYLLTIEASPASASTVSHERHRVRAGEAGYLSASPRLGYSFKQWMIGDSIVSNNSRFYFVMPAHDVVLTAYYEWNPEYDPMNPGDPEDEGYSHKVNLYATPSAGGYFNYASFTLAEGKSTKIYAYPREGYSFESWTYNGAVISTDNPMTITMGQEDLSYVATFTYNPLPPVEPSANMFNEETGEVLIDNFTPGTLNNAIYAVVSSDKYSLVKSITVKGQMTSNDFGFAYNFSNCTLIDLSLTTGYTAIPSGSFYGARALTQIILPPTVEYIGDHAFIDCSSLTSITIPQSVTYIGEGAFLGCSGLQSIVVEDGNPVYDSRNNCNAIIETATNKLLQGCNNTVIPNNVTSIETGAFYGCTELTSVTIPNSVTDIGDGAFSGCTGLITITSYITTPSDISPSAFDGINNQCVISVPAGTETLYEDKTGWDKLVNIKELSHMIIANSFIREYGDSNPTLTYSSTKEPLNGTPNITCSATKASPAGEYDIIVSKGSVTSSDIAYINGKLTVTKAPLKISVMNYVRNVGEENPTFELVYSGFKNGETEAVLTKKPTITCSATKDSPVGTYTISVSGGEATNYNISYENGTLTIATSLFKENNMSFFIEGQTAVFYKGMDAEEMVVPTTVPYNGLTYPVTGIADGAFSYLNQLKTVRIPSSIKTVGMNLFSGSPHVAAIFWEAPVQMTQEMAGNLANNPNLLFYTPYAAYAPGGMTNVINSRTKQAERIVLADAKDVCDFYCPETFTTGEITYTHEYKLFTIAGKCQGWETLALPFDVNEITHEKNGIITPFGALQVGHEFDNGTKPFWLYEFTTGGRFAEAEGIVANTPYIISMPNEFGLLDEYLLNGNVTFRGINATVPATSMAKTIKSGNLCFVPNYQNGTTESVYLLNVERNYDGNPKGSVFVKSDLLERQAHPFQAYFNLGSAGVKEYFNVFDRLTDGIRSMESVHHNNKIEYYQLDGTRRTTLQRGLNIVRLSNGKKLKVAIK